jgi:hypothetical protein
LVAALAGMVKLSYSTRRDATTLPHLAGELNVPVEALLEEATEGEAGELLALLSHWLAIKGSQGRRRVLSVARQEAGQSGYKECA